MKTDVDTALKDIADFFIKNRRCITDAELGTILEKHCENVAEIADFIDFLKSKPGKVRFKTLLNEKVKEDFKDNIEVYTSEIIPEDVARSSGLHRDPEVEYRYTTMYGGPDLDYFRRDLEKLLREELGKPYFSVDVYYLR